MATERGQNRLIFLFAGKIKNLRKELQQTIDRKKIAEKTLRDLKWEAKEKKRNPWIKKRITKKSMTSCLAGSTKKKA